MGRVRASTALLEVDGGAIQRGGDLGDERASLLFVGGSVVDDARTGLQIQCDRLTCVELDYFVTGLHLHRCSGENPRFVGTKSLHLPEFREVAFRALRARWRCTCDFWLSSSLQGGTRHRRSQPSRRATTGLLPVS